jgi:exodeoxyribonuclease VII small subunit
MNDATNTAAAPDPNAPDFETALARLESLVTQMESGSMPLEKSLAAYQEGVNLARYCQQRLDAAEEQVKVLQGNLLRPLSGGDAGQE